MKNIRAVPILISLLLLLACEDFFGRYDPVEESGYIFELKDFNFLQGSASNNSTALKIDSYGSIDKDKREVSLTLPPSFNFSSTILTATAGAENIGMDNDSTYYWFEIFDSTWKSLQKMKMTKELVGYSGDEETYYDLEYDINIKKELLASIEAVSAHYSDIPPYYYIYSVTPDMKIIFNDLISGATLTSGDFTADYSLSNPTQHATIFNQYIASPSAALSEKEYFITLNGNSCEASTVGYFNSHSNTYRFVVDLYPPSISTGILSSSTNWTPVALSDFVFNVSFTAATDTLTPAQNLQYKLCYDTTNLGNGSFVTGASNLYNSFYYIPVGGKEWFNYTSPININYSDLPDIFRNQMLTTQTFYYNIIVRDNCQDSVMSSIYGIPANTPVSTSFTTP